MIMLFIVLPMYMINVINISANVACMTYGIIRQKNPLFTFHTQVFHDIQLY